MIPVNVLRILDLLEENGPMFAEDLSDRLRRDAVILGPATIHRLCARFPDCLRLDSDSRVCLAPADRAPLAPSKEPGTVDGWSSIAQRPAHEIWVAQSKSSDVVSEVVLASLSGERIELTRAGDEPAGNMIPPENRHSLGVVICDVRQVAQLSRFLAGVEQMAVIAWQELAALVAVDESYESIDDALTWLDLDLPDTADTVDRLSSIVLALLKRVDVADPNWDLAIRVLGAAQSPWAQVLGIPVGEFDLDAALRPLLDPLQSSSIDVPAPFSASSGTADALSALSRQHGMRTRSDQHEMAQAVASALDAGEVLMVEAPTGTGKTLAYLIPAAARAGRSTAPVVIATHSKVLQRQVHAEVDRLRGLGLFNVPFRQIFGVSNYVCAREITARSTSLLEGGAVDEGHAIALAVGIRALVVTSNGVWDDATDQVLIRHTPGYFAGRRLLAVETDDCAGSNCPSARRCPLMLRRNSRPGGQAGVISTSHALVATSAKAAGSAFLLGSDEEPATLIFDEAHRLEDSLTAAWTEETGRLPVRGLAAFMARKGRFGQACRTLERVGVSTSWIAGIDAAASRYLEVEDELASAVSAYMGEYTAGRDSVELRRGVVAARPEYALIRDAAVRLSHLISQGRRGLEAASVAISGRFEEIQSGALNDVWRALKSAHRRHVLHESLLRSIVDLDDGPAVLHLIGQDWLAGDPLWKFHRIPIEVGPQFRESITDPTHATVFTSATLRVAGTFEYFKSRLAIPEGARSLALKSPFDADRQSLVVMTSHLPIPVPANEDEFVEEVTADLAGFLSLSRGRTLVLFAATKRMKGVAEGLSHWEIQLAERGVHVLVQGAQSPSEIQRRFRADLGTVLLGVQSYWEGFDAPGDTLSFLAIEKAPFPAPDEPITAARSRLILERGGNPFLDYIVPRTAIAMTQGFGRLIRTETDRGAVLILDRRLQYPSVANQIILSSLPTTNIVFARDRDEAWASALRFVDGGEPDLTEAFDVPTSGLEAALEAHMIQPGEDPHPKLRAAARAIFAIETLHAEQLEMMSALLSGRDVVGILPTGTGKSLIFQLPTLLRTDRLPTVVISPLVALIKDQVDDLRSRRGLRMVAGITGRTSGAERTELLRDLSVGRLRLLYVSPERMVSDIGLRTALASRELGLLVVDEAHCISAWGHDFRPEFRQIARSTREFRRSPRLALTATATQAVTGDIVRSLEMNEPLIIRRPVARGDLRYRVMEVGGERDRVREILRLIAHDPNAYGLVYVSRRAIAEEVAWLLRQASVSARAYHAGMDPDRRESVQEDFLSGGCQVVVSTNAFGMGVNKPDISWVVHFEPPQSLEAYVQEAGRAARTPGMTGDSLLLHRPGDLVRVDRLIGSASDSRQVNQAILLWERLRSGSDDSGLCSFSAEDWCSELDFEADDLSVTLGWLESTGHLERLPDSMVAGMVNLGAGEPGDSGEREQFLQITLAELKLRPLQARRIQDLADLAGRVGITNQALGELLIRWTLNRFITFQPTQRNWLVLMQQEGLDDLALARAVESWRRAQLARLREVRGYLSSVGTDCRRVRIAATFGDEGVTCHEIPGAEICDICTSDRPRWHAVPLERVPDLEGLINIDTVVLNAVRWSEGFTKGRYAESGLCMALLGKEFYPSGAPLGRGLLTCPQFGAIKYLRGADRQLKQSIGRLLVAGSLERIDGGYPVLRLTEPSRRRLSGLPESAGTV